MSGDTAAMNVKFHNLVAAKTRPQYKLVLCQNHRYETAINTKFQKPKLNETSQTKHKNTYYLFKKSTHEMKSF